MALNKQAIINYIPQRQPFIMVDDITTHNETSTSTSFKIMANNIFVENNLLKEPALLENIAQTAAARAGYIANTENKPVQVGYIGAIKNVEIFFLPTVGDKLITEITIENQIFNVTLIAGKIRCNNRIVAQCQMKIFINQA